MRITNIENVEEFFKMIGECRGTVELVTDEGDRLNLKSKLSQSLILANVFSHGKFDEVQIVAHEKEDIDRIYRYLMSEV